MPTTNDEFGLARFVDAQDAGGTYDSALAELKNGQKVSHWMWFVFPQIAGLGSSFMAQQFALSGLEEAQAYLAHPVLGSRLRHCVQALLRTGSSDAVGILGPIDAQKLRSSMTLYDAVEPAGDFRRVLEQFFDGQPDPETTSRL